MDSQPVRPGPAVRIFKSEGIFPTNMGIEAHPAGTQGQGVPAEAVPNAFIFEYEGLTLMIFEPDPRQPTCMLLSDNESVTYIFAPVTSDRAPEEEVALILFANQTVVIHMPRI